MPGIEGSTILKVMDLCLPSKSENADKKSKALVNVIGVHKVDLKVVDQIQVGTVVTAEIELWDQFNQIIDVSSISENHLKISVLAAKKQIAIVENSGKRLEVKVKGADLGHTTLTASAIYGNRKVDSAAMPLHVFPALELDPKNVTLIIGAKFQVQVLGGPGQADSTIEFSIGNGRIANLDSTGLIDAKTLGSTKVTAKAIGVDKNTGKRIGKANIKFRISLLDGTSL